MLTEVCSVLGEQRQLGIPRVKVSVNFSRKHIYDKEFVEHLCKIADEYKVPHDMIQVEITESALCDTSPEEVDRFVGAIRAQGFSVAMDDFGIGMTEE